MGIGTDHMDFDPIHMDIIQAAAGILGEGQREPCAIEQHFGVVSALAHIVFGAIRDGRP